MPRYMLNGKAVNMNGKFVEYNNSQLSFQVIGTHFPFSLYEPPNSNVALYNDTRFIFNSSENNTAVIDYGDGNIKNYTFKSNSLDFRPSIPMGDAIVQERHVYTDGNAGLRTIRISFGKPDKITEFKSRSVNLYNSFPKEISALTKLSIINIFLSNLTVFPPSVSLLNNLKSLTLTRIGTAISNRLPDEFLKLKLEVLSLSDTIDLNDPSASNFINFCNSGNKDTLIFLDIDSCNILTLPDNISNLVKLVSLRIGSRNVFKTMPTQINTITSLTSLNVGTFFNSNPNILFWSSVSNLTKLINLEASSCINLETNLPAGLENCIKLKTYNADGTYRTNSRVNEFVTNFYNFINTNALKSGLSTLPFRGMTMICPFIAPSGNYQQPSGYIAGSNNGTPTSPKEMIWVLVNQYSHTVIYTS